MFDETVSRQVIRMRDRGRITIPASLREKYGLEKGTELVLLEKEGRLVLYPSRWEQVEDLLDQVGEALRERGTTLSEVLKDSEDVRKEVFRERYPDLAQKYDL